MASKFRKSLMQNSYTRKSSIVQSHEFHMPFSNWTIVEQNIDTLYQIGSLDFKTVFSIKVHEETFSVYEPV